MSGPRRIVIVGRDTALWLAAAVLGRALGPAGVAVDAVELPSRLSRADMLATLPPIEALHTRIGIQEERLLRATGGSFSFGHNFVGLGSDDPAFFHGWGSYGGPIDGQPFLGHWLRARRFGLDAAFQDFCLTAVAAKNGRMLLPDEETEAFGRTDYGYHLPALAYAGYLKGAAQAAGVGLHQAHSVDVTRREDGSIGAVTLDGGVSVTGELFVDATGPEALLTGGGLRTPVESWRAVFPADRRLVATAAPLASIPPYADIRAGETGWTALHPATAATGIVHVYAGDRCSDEAALCEARAASGLSLAEATIEPIAPGFREPWTANCVAIGEAACVLDPIHSAGLHMVQLGLVQLLALVPAGADATAERAEYNRVIRSHAERLRDFQAAYYLTSRQSGAFWDRARAAPVDPALAHRLSTFAARGTIAPIEDDSFSPDSWQALLLGQGFVPDSWPPSVDATSPERLRGELQRLLGFIAAKVRAQPRHDDYLRRVSRSAAA